MIAKNDNVNGQQIIIFFYRKTGTQIESEVLSIIDITIDYSDIIHIYTNFFWQNNNSTNGFFAYIS